MSAAEQRSDSATPPAVRMRADIFDKLAETHGATNDAERARLVGIERTTLYRIREGKVVPKLETAMQIAQRLDVTVEDLFEVTA
ncbi:helix-turn-helix transcriptional regulator [Micromonospora aurantiaca (nom. illeg.)]|uniref:helix-turn-helix transcriptional regulator n=1 Tax=Micromonospora aurantiaca (nom. illeg.) TaxID=47850 RepID=UPI003EB8ED0E